MIAGEVIDGKFEVVDEIGRGGMGVVLRVRDQDSGDLVALKFCMKRTKSRAVDLHVRSDAWS